MEKICLIGSVVALYLVSIVPIHATPDKIRVGFVEESMRLEGSLPTKDVRIATEIFIGKVLEKSGDYLPTFDVYQNGTSLMSAIMKGTLDLVEIHPVDYVRNLDSLNSVIEPAGVVQISETRLESFMLLAAPGKSLKDLKGKRVLICKGRGRGLERMWLDDLCHQAVGGAADSHFGEVVTQDDSQRILVSTFFGKADACVIRTTHYRIAFELNPQIGRKLKPVSISGGFPLFFIAIRKAIPEDVKDFLRNEEILAPTQPEWVQAYEMLRIKRLNPSVPEDFHSLIELVNRVDARANSQKVANREQEK